MHVLARLKNCNGLHKVSAEVRKHFRRIRILGRCQIVPEKPKRLGALKKNSIDSNSNSTNGITFKISNLHWLKVVLSMKIETSKQILEIIFF